MLRKPEKIIEGVKIIEKLNVSSAYIGIEDNKHEAIASMQKAAEGTRIEIVPLKTKYPQGRREKQLIKAVLNRSSFWSTSISCWCCSTKYWNSCSSL